MFKLVLVQLHTWHCHSLREHLNAIVSSGSEVGLRYVVVIQFDYILN